jgi:hypothetical protein
LEQAAGLFQAVPISAGRVSLIVHLPRQAEADALRTYNRIVDELVAQTALLMSGY